MTLIVRRAGPQMTIQDLGRPGFLSQGLSRGGAADRLAVLEGAALLDQAPTCAVVEMAGAGGIFEATQACRIALTGAPMSAKIGDATLPWNATAHLAKGERLVIGAATSGTYGYLSIGGGFETPEILGSRAAHLVAGIGDIIATDAQLPVGEDPAPSRPSMRLEVSDRTKGGTARIVPGAQTPFYSEAERQRFEETEFTRGQRGNRQGVMLMFEGEPFAAEGQRTILSEVIIPGDIQMTGEGRPFVLLPESQTTGGYPRIGSVLPDDLPMVAQAAPGTKLRFRFLTHADAMAAHTSEEDILRTLRAKVTPRVRDPRDITNLASYQLISGVTSGDGVNAMESER